MIELNNTSAYLQTNEIKDQSLNLVVTSPPYKDEDGFSWRLIEDTFSRLIPKLLPKSLLFVNFGHLAGYKSRPFKMALQIENMGYKLEDTFVWVKNHYRPIQGERRVNNLTEFVFMFSHKGMPKLNRLAVGVPYADKGNVNRFAKGNDLKCGGNTWNIQDDEGIWKIPYENLNAEQKKLHNDRFPLGLPEKCIKICGYPIVKCFDPFSGSGTTLLACKNLGVEGVGSELNSENYKVAKRRLSL